MFTFGSDLTNSGTIWKQSFFIARSLWKSATNIGLIGIILPLILLNVINWIEAASSIHRLIETMTLPTTTGFEQTLQYLVTYVGTWSMGSFIALCWIEIGFIWLIKKTCFFCEQNVSLSFRTEWFNVIKILPKFFLTLFVVGLILALSQAITLLFLVFSILLFMAPIILIHEGCGVFRAISRSLTLSYAGPTKGIRLYILFQLISAGMIFLLYPMMTIQLKDFLLHLDDIIQIPRTLWTKTIFNHDLNGFLFIADLISSALLWVGICVFTVLMAVFYSLLRNNLNQPLRHQND